MKTSQRISIQYKIGTFLIVIFPILILSVGCKQENKPIQEDENSSEINNVVKEFTKTITLNELKKHVYDLSSDNMEGRFSATKGAKKAAAYIIKHLQALDLKGLPDQGEPYLQKFRMQKKKLVDCYLENENGRVENWVDFGERFCHFSGEKDAELVFVGYGRDSDFEGIDVKGKLAAFFVGGPATSELIAEKEKIKINTATELGAIGHLMILRDEKARSNYELFRKNFYGETRYYLFKRPEEALHSERGMVIFASALAKLFGVSTEELLSVIDDLDSGKNMSGKFKARVHMKTSYEVYETLNGENVLGFMEGTDKQNEWIILTAHYDHLGKYGGDIYNGADDNASGMAAILEIAEAFTLAARKGHRPRRNILFLFPDAEEIGANGSSYYVDNPVVPLANTVVDINIDAIGREDTARPDLKDFIFVYCSSKAKADFNEARTETEKRFKNKLRIEIRKSPPGSDNFIFERSGVPVIAYTTGRSKDYHKPSDTANKIHYDNLTNITQMIFSTVWEIANRE